MPAIYHEGSWLGNATDPEVLVKDTVGWTGKNLLKNKATTQTINGVTFTVNADKSVTVNGTATAQANFQLNTESVVTTENLIISDGVNEHANDKYFVYTKDPDNHYYYTYDSTCNIPAGKTLNVINITVRSGVTANNVKFYPMLRKADITDPTYEPYHESVEQTLRDAEVIEGKNLFVPQNVRLVSGETVGNTTFTPQNNTAVVAKLKHNMDYVASHAASGYSNPRFRLALSESYPVSGGGCYTVVSDASLTNYQFNSGNYNYALLHCAGSIESVDAVQAMLCTKEEWDKSQDFEPYYIPLKESKVDWTSQGVLGAKNLLNPSMTTQTRDGLTFTVNNDNTVTVNGTATASGGFAVLSTRALSFDGCILNGNPSTDNTKIKLIYYDETSGRQFDVPANNGEVLISNTNGDNCRVVISYYSGATVSNLTFRPMIRLASDPDDTYQPYAMTNRELTEVVTVKSDSITSSLTANGDVANGLKKIGEIVFIDAAYKEVTASQWGVIATIPAGFRPKTPCRLLDGYGKKSLVINVNGDIQAAESISNTYVYIHGSWVVS